MLKEIIMKKKVLLVSLFFSICLTVISQQHSYRHIDDELLPTSIHNNAENKSPQEKVFPGADEHTISRSQYFSWINNTNEGTTEEQTIINLNFFKWLQDEYGMILDIYAFDAGLIDGKNFYGSMHSDRFKKKFPEGLNEVYNKAKEMHTRLGLWGGPDGFGDTKEEAKNRKEEIISLCKDYEWALFKFDAVCGQLRADKEDHFIDMMKQCRIYSPDLILLNHRLALDKGKPYATTFLWEGNETYIDVFSHNTVTAPHNRAGALGRGLVPELKRLTEDHGVCISSCIDYWEDDLILQAFNRSLILSPQIYGNPWLMRDDEFSKLARIYNLHRNYASILVDGIVLPDTYGPFPVSRGDDSTRLVTLRNLNWDNISYTVKLDKEIGLNIGENVEVRQYHPTEKIIGTFNYGDKIEISVPPFRSILLLVTSKKCDEPGIKGVDYYVNKNVPGKPVEIDLLGLPGTQAEIKLPSYIKAKKILVDGQEISELQNGKSYNVLFEGKALTKDHHRKLNTLKPVSIPSDVDALYEATIFAADNNALEVRSLERSGDTSLPMVKAARDAFFTQSAFINRGVWDKNLFDGNMDTGFWPSKRYGKDARINEGCFRLDLGEVKQVDSIVFRIKDEYSMQPYLMDEGNFAHISSNLNDWNTIVFLAGLKMNIEVGSKMRYLKLPVFPDRISEVEVYADGRKLDSSLFRASNLFTDVSRMKCKKVWKEAIVLDEIAENSYISVAVNGEHGNEGAYAALKVDGKYVGAPSRAVSYPSNTWEYVNVKTSSNYTYYFPVSQDMIGKTIEIYVMAYEDKKLDLNPEAWISAYPVPYKKKRMVIIN